jgi:predicted  nucleic acid-binding Zn-ribbon protein
MAFNIFKSSKELEQVKADNAALVSNLAEKEKELTEARSLAQQLTDSNLELGKEIEGLKGQVETAKKSAGLQAAQTLAAIGIPEGTVKESVSADPTAEEIFAQYQALQKTDPAAATNLYRQHRAKFIKTLNH